MKVKTSELTGAVLDWVVTEIEDPDALRYGVKDWLEQRRHTVKHGEYVFRWHQSWAQGGPIIERERIEVTPNVTLAANDIAWIATRVGVNGRQLPFFGPTPPIAAMRCYVAGKLGDEVDVPNELLSKE